MIAGNPAHEAFGAAEAAEMDGNCRDGGDGDEEAEFMDAEEAGQNGEGQKLGGRTHDQAAAGCGIGERKRQKGAVASGERRSAIGCHGPRAFGMEASRDETLSAAASLARQKRRKNGAATVSISACLRQKPKSVFPLMLEPASCPRKGASGLSLGLPHGCSGRLPPWRSRPAATPVRDGRPRSPPRHGRYLTIGQASRPQTCRSSPPATEIEPWIGDRGKSLTRSDHDR